LLLSKSFIFHMKAFWNRIISNQTSQNSSQPYLAIELGQRDFM